MSEQLLADQGIFTGRTLADYPVVIHAANPKSRNYNRAQVEGERDELLNFFEVIPVETTADKFETALIIEEAMGNIAHMCVIRARTGDGGNGGLVRAAIGRGVPLWQESDGFANNFGRSCFGIIDRGIDGPNALKRVLDKARIARTGTVRCTITDPEGNIVYQEDLADQFGIGDMANAQVAREDPTHREHLRKVSKARGLISTAIVGGLAIVAAADFKIVREEPSLETMTHPAQDDEVDPSKIETYNELAWTNLEDIAKFGNIRNIRMTDKKLVEFYDSYQRQLAGPVKHYAALYTYGVKGRDIPVGEQVQFRLLTDANAQGSGDPFVIYANSRVNIQYGDKELLAVTTKSRP